MKLLTVFFALAFATNLTAEEEPTGFRGQKFGERPVGLIEIPTTNKDGTSVFIRKDEKLNIGPAKLKSISYLAYKGNLYGILIEFEGSTNYEHITTTLTAAYGNPIHHTDETYEKSAGWRMQNGVQIYISMNTISDSGKAIYVFQPIKAQQEQDEKERARKASDDL